MMIRIRVRTIAALAIVAVPVASLSRQAYKDYRAKGVVYERTDLRSGKSYVGQAWDWERYEQRQKEEAAKYKKKSGVDAKFEFRVLARPLQSELDMVEQGFINKRGSFEKKGGPLENRREQVRDFERESELRQKESPEERYERRNESMERSRRIRESRKEEMRRDTAERTRRLRERNERRWKQ